MSLPHHHTGLTRRRGAVLSSPSKMRLMLFWIVNGVLLLDQWNSCSTAKITVRAFSQQHRRQFGHQNDRHYPKRHQTALWSSFLGSDRSRSSQNSTSSLTTNRNSNDIFQGITIPGLLGHDSEDHQDNPNALFEQLDAIHSTMATLQRQLPYLLQSAWTRSEMAALHTEDTQIVVARTSNSNNNNNDAENFILVTNLDELVTIQNALTYLILLGPLRAQSALQGALQQLQQLQEQLQQQQQQQNSPSSLLSSVSSNALERPMVQCQIILPINDTITTQIVPDHVRVKWQVQLVSPALQLQLFSQTPSLPGTVSNNNANTRGGLLQGISRLEFAPSSGKIRRHVLQKLQFDGTTVDASTLGQVVSQAQRLKNLVETTSPDWVKNLVVDGLWQNVAKPWILRSSSSSSSNQEPQRQLTQQQSSSTLSNQQASPATPSFEESRTKVAPLYARIPIQNETKPTPNTTFSIVNEATRVLKYTIVPIDQAQEFIYNHSTVYDGDDRPKSPSPFIFPIPGSQQWTDYAIVHRGTIDFCSYIIPQLATGSSPALLSPFFTSNARLVDTQKTTLVQTGADLQTFYASLATLRQRTRGSWTMERAQFLKWQSSSKDPHKQLAAVRIHYHVQLAGPLDTTLAGTDVYFLEITAARPKRPLVLIAKIQQEKLSIDNIPGSNGMNQNAVTSAEASMFMKSLTSAVFDSRNTGFWQTADESFLLQVWQRLPFSPASSNAISSSFNSMLPQSEFTQEAASRAFFIMSALHQQGKLLVLDPTTPQSPPGLEFMTDSVTLLGYLGDILLRGKQQYRQNVGFLASSLTKGLESGRIISEKPPSTQVSLTAENRIEFSWTLYLRLSMTGFSPSDFLFLRNGNSQSGSADPPFAPPSGIPLRIQLRSEYVLDPITGDITQHRLLESLVNGQLTPADMLSRFLQGRENNSGNSNNPFGGFGDAIQWLLRSRNG